MTFYMEEDPQIITVSEISLSMNIPGSKGGQGGGIQNGVLRGKADKRGMDGLREFITKLLP